MPTRLKNQMRFILLRILLFGSVALNSCATIPLEQKFDDFVVVRTQRGDSLASLSSKYMGTPEKKWQIAEFNKITSVSPGQEILIPLRPFKLGGLCANGYQIVPVLTYFGFSKDKPSKFAVTERAFSDQMKFLKQNGYSVISLDQLMTFLEFKGQIPNKSLVISFDDGWASFYDIAVPILKQYGFPATLFMDVDFIGNKKALAWDQVKFLAEDGFDVQCKINSSFDMDASNKESVKHYFLALQSHIAQAKKTIEQKLNKECRYVAYKYGKNSNFVIALLKNERFHAAFSISPGNNPFYVDKYKIHRSAVYGSFSLERFEKNLSVFSESRLE